MKIYNKFVCVIRATASLVIFFLILAPFLFAHKVSEMQFPVGVAIFVLFLSEALMLLIFFSIYTLLRWILENEFIQKWWSWVTTKDIEERFIDKI